MAEQRADGMSLLKGLKRNLPEQGLPERGRIASAEEAERRILPGEGAPAVALVAPRDVTPAVAPETLSAILLDASLEGHLDATQERRPEVTQYTSLLRKKKKYTTTFTLRMDLELYRRLKDIADFNELQMTSIINEAVSLHLAAFEQPPPNWKRRR